MIEQDIVVNTKYGRQPAFAVCPDGPGGVPGIIDDFDDHGHARDCEATFPIRCNYRQRPRLVLW